MRLRRSAHEWEQRRLQSLAGQRAEAGAYSAAVRKLQLRCRLKCLTIKKRRGGTMKLSATDVRIDHLYLGPGKGGRLVVTHLPSGLSVTEDIPMTKSVLSIQHRLLSALEMKIIKEGKS